MKKNSFSIKKKTFLMIIVFALVLVLVSMWVYARVISNMNSERFRTAATNIAATVAQVVDAERFVRVRDNVLSIYNATENKVHSDKWGSDEWNEYTARFDSVAESKDFIELRDQLRKIQDVNPVDCVYLSVIDTKLEQFVYIVDAAYEGACPPGCIDELYEMNRPLLKDPEYGLPAYITDTEEYGWLVTAGIPIHDGNGEVVGYALTDISMEEVRSIQRTNIMKMFGYLVASVALICTVGIVSINYTLVKPIKQLKQATLRYKNEKLYEKHGAFSKVDIKTHDELADLAESMKDMEDEINSQIEELSSVNSKLSISRTVAHEMTELANKDALTGVRNKTAYDNRVSEIDRELSEGRDMTFGVAMVDLNYLKTINDTYGHGSGDVAIKKLSSIICDTFVHSEVFRIGGDEFAVIVRDSDYENVEALIADMNSHFEQISADDSVAPQDKVSAAIGFAAYDPAIDKSFGDVFARADTAMYERKRSMKNI